jgi:hypothetical protein
MKNDWYIVRMTPGNPARIDLIPHSFDGPTISYSEADREVQSNPELRATVERWKDSFSRDRFGRKV